jgi:hypothetical protein
VQLKPVRRDVAAKTQSTPNSTHQASSSTTEDETSNNNGSGIYTDHIKPKSIIEKFEQLTKFNNAAASAPTTTPNTVTGMHDSNKKHSSASQNSMYAMGQGAASLTFVSSMQSISTNAGGRCSGAASSTGQRSPTIEDLENDTYQYEDDQTMAKPDEDGGVVYEELALPPPTQFKNDNYRSRDVKNATNMTSLFGDETQGDFTAVSMTQIDDDTVENNEDEDVEGVDQVDFVFDGKLAGRQFKTSSRQLPGTDAYSLSGCSSYTGSVMNQDEFEDDQDALNGDDESYFENTCDDQLTNETSDETTGAMTTVTEDETVCNEIHAPVLKQLQPTSVGYLDNGSISATTTTTSSTESTSEPPVTVAPIEPLFSIKEYRKQKRCGHSGNSRRSSIMPRSNNGTQKTNSTNSAQTSTASRKSTIAPVAQHNSEAAIAAEEQAPKTKYAERIKEMEELIRQEDNVISQTGVALEKCLTDAHFSGSGEHIECNRLLLISCQKRQAYLTEINRLRSLIATNKKSPSMTQLTSTASNGTRELSPADLTGLLIFSDLQLPVKESYINRLKSGEEKRVFFFLCLIRNGIQVLQTQVMSVQELIGSRDTSITFPNRMAINSVDINFKVKVDIYTLVRQYKSS